MTSRTREKRRVRGAVGRSEVDKFDSLTAEVINSMPCAYRVRRKRCEGRPTVPEDIVPVPCRWGSMARRKVSF